MEHSEMLEPPPNEETSQIISASNSNVGKKQKKRKRKNKQKKLRQLALKDLKRKDIKFNHTMSAWAESFTEAATWQLKHQLAYWKAKATSLSYENNVLREIIQNKFEDPVSAVEPGTSVVVSDSDESCVEHNGKEVETDGSDLEASEELIQFLAANAKYKEDARREREKLKAKEEESNIELLEETPQEATDSRQENLKQLYGERWQTISALETSVQLHFMSECDKSKPTYWPNIPFNFNFS